MHPKTLLPSDILHKKGLKTFPLEMIDPYIMRYSGVAEKFYTYIKSAILRGFQAYIENQLHGVLFIQRNNSRLCKKERKKIVF